MGEILPDRGQGLVITRAAGLIIDGRLSTFVNCGSQYAIWRQFPRAIAYKLVDLDSGLVYESIDMTLSISESGNEIFNHYSKEPCNQVVSKSFAVSLEDILFQNAPKHSIVNFSLEAEYAGHKSNTIELSNIPILLRGF